MGNDFILGGRGINLSSRDVGMPEDPLHVGSDRPGSATIHRAAVCRRSCSVQFVPRRISTARIAG
jgi:hypothetical protein